MNASEVSQSGAAAPFNSAKKYCIPCFTVQCPSSPAVAIDVYADDRVEGRHVSDDLDRLQPLRAMRFPLNAL